MSLSVALHDQITLDSSCNNGTTWEMVRLSRYQSSRMLVSFRILTAQVPGMIAEGLVLRSTEGQPNYVPQRFSYEVEVGAFVLPICLSSNLCTLRVFEINKLKHPYPGFRIP